MSAGPTVTQTVRPPQRSIHLVLESNDRRAFVPIPKRSTAPCDIDTVLVDSLKVLDPRTSHSRSGHQDYPQFLEVAPSLDTFCDCQLFREQQRIGHVIFVDIADVPDSFLTNYRRRTILDIAKPDVGVEAILARFVPKAFQTAPAPHCRPPASSAPCPAPPSPDRLDIYQRDNANMPRRNECCPRRAVVMSLMPSSSLAVLGFICIMPTAPLFMRKLWSKLNSW